MIKIKSVIKRDGTTQKFKRHYLERSVHRAMVAAKFADGEFAKAYAGEVIRELEKSRKEVVKVEKIKSAVCLVLKKHNMKKACDEYMFVWLHLKPVNLTKVMKRDGSIEKFHIEKLFKSIHKSIMHTGINDSKLAHKITKQVITILEKRFDGKTIPIENIKETVEFVLVKAKHPGAAKKYILHRYM